MKIKSTYIMPPHVNAAPKFPLLAKSRHQASSRVILFSSDGVGVVVAGDGVTEQHTVGHYSDQWRGIDSGIWEVLPTGSKVTLEVQ